MTGFRSSGTSNAQLDELIEEATVDCYNEDEQVTGLFTMLEDNLALPFQTSVLGMAVSVVGVDLADSGQIVDGLWPRLQGREASLRREGRRNDAKRTQAALTRVDRVLAT